ncbi:MAG: hypothetical protein HYV76_01855 [Candidatus Vogelbacteria bacterium]|nr:hypothetical protein [Candidatus Vogelbacteria bacterium]
MKKIVVIFGVAFGLNLIWENLHSVLYSHYQGGAITELILMRASLFDAVVITIITLPFLLWRPFKNNHWLMVMIGLVVAVINEWYGLSTVRWAYNDLMPIIPIIAVGLTPTLQLGLLSYWSYRLTKWLTT